MSRIALALFTSFLLCGFATSALGQVPGGQRWGITEAEWASVDGNVMRYLVRASSRQRELEQAAAEGDDYAQAIVAGAHSQSIWGKPDDALAVQYAQQSAEARNVRGMLMLAEFLRTGRGIRKDEVAAGRWVQAAADTGSPLAAAFLSNYLQFGFGGLAGDVDRQVRLDRSAAEGGSGMGMARLAWRCLNGVGVPRNESEAARLYDLATRAGNINAYYELATLYANGRGVAKNSELAATLMREGANLGGPSAMYGWGYYLYNGIGTGQSKAEGVRWLLAAMEAGSADAKATYAGLLLAGDYLPRDLARGTELYSEAAEAGSLRAMYGLGLAYQQGKLGAAPNHAAALGWFMRGAEREDPASLFAVGAYYEIDPALHDQARIWYQKSADRGFSPAKEVLTELDRAAEARARRESETEAQRKLIVARQAQEARSAAALRNPTARSQGAPTDAEILAMTTRMRAEAFSWRTTSYPGQLIVPSLLGDTISYRRSVTGTRCTAAGRNAYTCSYDLITTMEAANDDTVGGLMGAFSSAIFAAAGTNITRAHVTNQFIRADGRWTSPTVQKALAEEMAANAQAGRSRGPSCPSCDTFEQQRARDRGNFEMMRDLQVAPSWHR